MQTLIEEFSERQSIQEVLEKDERFEVIKEMVQDQYRYITRVKCKELGDIEAILKIPLLTPNAREECSMPYDLVREAHEPKFLARLVGEKPVEFKGDEKEYFGILSIPAVLDLEKVVQQAMEKKKAMEDRGEKEDEASKQDWEDKILKVFHQAAKTLSEIHRVGYVHRDIKLSNIFGYEDDFWAVADYGTLTKDDQENKPKSTHSAKNAEQFQSPEYKGGKTKYSIDEDIFAFGVALYMALTKKVSNDMYHNSSKEYRDAIEKTIPNLDVSDRSKYLLKRLLGRKLMTKPQSGKTAKDYRYRSIDVCLAEFNGEQVSEEIEDIVSSEEYTDFLKAHKEFVDALNSAEENRDGKWGTVNYVTIDRIMEAHKKFLELGEKVKLAPKRNELLTSSIEVYTDVRAREEEILRGAFKKFEAGEISKEEFWPAAYEIIYLWGPPFTDRKEDKGAGEKARYAIDEIRKRKTHFHNKVFNKKEGEKEESDEEKSLVEILEGFGELSDQPSESSEEAGRHLKSGNSRFGVGKLNEAISEYETAIRLDPVYAAAYNNLGVAKGRIKDFDGAAAALKKAIEIKPEDIKAHNNLGNIYLRQRHLEALGEYEVVLALEPVNVAALNNIGVAWHRLANNTDSAVENLEKAVALDSNNSTIHFNLANAYKAKGDFLKAISEYKKAMDLNKPEKESIDADKDIKEAREAIEKDPNDASAHFKLAYALSEKGDKEGAKKTYQKALEINPDYGASHNNLGVIFSREGNTDEAVKHYREAVRCGSWDPLYRNNLARTLKKRGELDEAEKEFKEGINRFRICRSSCVELGNIYQGLGNLYQSRGNIDKAIETHIKGIEDDPSYTYNQNCLISLLENKPDAKTILDDLKRRGKENPDKAFAQIFLGIALELEKDNQGANSAYEKAADLMVGSKGETIDLIEENAK
ncbi:tetratricopeptide repeat protein [Candidatus Woesearchaeota archaeon]|nr:tetratricopeptide repeat protein [Candidatus Woesearchaeota archaeon]